MTALIDNNLIHISAISSAYYSLAYFRPFLIFRSQRLSFLFIFILSLYSDEILTLCIKVPISYCSWCLPILTSIGLAEGKKKAFLLKNVIPLLSKYKFFTSFTTFSWRIQTFMLVDSKSVSPKSTFASTAPAATAEKKKQKSGQQQS